jgi:hypothetical protein
MQFLWECVVKKQRARTPIDSGGGKTLNGAVATSTLARNTAAGDAV